MRTDDQRKKRLCPTCGRLAYCDEHHPLGEASAPEVTIAACVGSCHPVESERQRIGGIALDHDGEPPLAEMVWAFGRGLSDVLVLPMLQHPRLGAEEAHAVEGSAVALGRAYDIASRAVGDPGIAGPDPRGNAQRISARRRSKRPDRSLPARVPPWDDGTEFERLRQLMKIVAQATAAMPQDGRVHRLTAGAGIMVDRHDVFVGRLRELEARGDADRLAACIGVGIELRDEATRALQAAGNLNQLAKHWPAVRALDAYIDRFLAFAIELAEASDGERAEAALQNLAVDLNVPTASPAST